MTLTIDLTALPLTDQLLEYSVVRQRGDTSPHARPCRFLSSYTGKSLEYFYQASKFEEYFVLAS
jgi:hypothetical protein